MKLTEEFENLSQKSSPIGQFSPFGRSCAKGLIAIRHATYPLSIFLLVRALGFSFVIALVVSVVLGISQEDSFRGHSFRRGAASWAFNCDVPGELIQLYGDWSSDSYKLYLEFSLESKLVLATQLRSAIVSVA